MTELLEQAIAEIKKLPADEQDAIAALILEEIEDETRWGRGQAFDIFLFLYGCDLNLISSLIRIAHNFQVATTHQKS